MSKRFTDTGKWKDSWFQDLPAKYKLFWIYILDECDHAGIYKPNIRLASFQIGEHFEEIEIKRILADRIEILGGGYWFIKKFIEFQYGELSAESRPHASIIRTLKNHQIKGYVKGIHTLKEQEQEQDKEKDNKNARKKFNQKPLPEDVGELPDIKIGSAIELIFRTQKITLDKATISNLYTKVFLPQNLTGDKFYQNESDVHSHFINWIKTQKFEQSNQPTFFDPLKVNR